MKISSTEFQQNIGRYQDAAMKEPVTITKNGRDHTVLVSADFFNAVLNGRIARLSGMIRACKEEIRQNDQAKSGALGHMNTLNGVALAVALAASVQDTLKFHWL